MDNAQHTSTSDQLFWQSSHLSMNQTFSETTTFKNAGIYSYVCEIHSFMTGQVRVPLIAKGSATAGWTIRWSSLSSTPNNRAFDVQLKRPGSTKWESYRANTSARSSFFNPTRTGDYGFRARTRNLSNGEFSAWSPALTVTIS